MKGHRRVWPAITVIVLFVGLTAFAQTQSFPMKHERILGNPLMKKFAQPPPGDWQLPTLNSKMPLYVVAEIAGNQKLFILDLSNSSDQFYNRLYWDANGNGDLTDDEIVDSESLTTPLAMGGFSSTYFPEQEWLIEVDGKSRSYRTSLSVLCEGELPQNKEEALKKVAVEGLATEALWVASGMGHLQSSLTKPPGEWKLPESISEAPQYAVFRAGDQPRMLVFDRAESSNGAYTRLYFDANNNRDLTDDPAYEGIAKEVMFGVTNVEFPVIETTILLDGKPMPYCFKLMIADEVAYYQGMSVYTVDFTVGDVECRMVMCDNNGNGRFGDQGRQSSMLGSLLGARNDPGDTIFFHTPDEPLDIGNQLPAAGVIGIAGKVFKVQTDFAAMQLTLTAVTENLGQLKLPSPPDRLVMRNMQDTLFLFKPGKEQLVPAGDYQLMSYTVMRKDEQGALWRMSTTASPGGSTLAVKRDTATEWLMGEPLKATIHAAPAVFGGNSVTMNFELSGAGGEPVSELVCVSGGNNTSTPMALGGIQPREPEYIITKADGEVVARGNFEYG